MNYIGLSSCDTANGPGVRVSLFVSGCTLRCKGCFNPESWDFEAGKPFTEETVETIFRYLDEPYVAGLSILGGDPLEESNIPVVTDLARRVKERYGDKRDVWLWTGRIYEKHVDLPLWQWVDTVVDGPFVEKRKVTQKGLWYGSDNQRVIPIHAAD
jgi:anaerobic ribonucleoside-triphosphate reductase activating protein